jgi:HAD superfamily hydrolase (TIGR01490 family)
MKIAAFFDLDYTLLEMNTIFRFVHYLVENRLIAIELADKVFRNVAKEKSYGTNRNKTNGMFFELFHGWSYEKYQDIGNLWWEQADKPFIEPVYSAFERLKKEGAYVVALSGSLSTCVEAISESVGMTNWWGSEPEVVEERLTGRVKLSMVGEQKSRKIKEFVTAHSGTVGSTIAFGDHGSNFQMLSAVDTPHLIVRPRVPKNIQKKAIARGWKVVELNERANPAILHTKVEGGGTNAKHE